MDTLAHIVLDSLLAYLAILVIIALIGVRRGSWLWCVEKDAALFRTPKLLAALPVMLALLAGSMVIVLLYMQVQDAATRPHQAVRDYATAGAWALYFGFVFLPVCWMIAPTELEVDLSQRRYRHTKHFFSKFQVTCGTLEDFAGVCISRSGGVMLVFRVRQGSLYGYRLGSYYGNPEKAAAGAQKMAEVLGLPIVPVPWR